MQKFSSIKAAVDFIRSTVGKDLRLATPLGLGKPNRLLNLIYQEIKADPQASLKIYTGLSLDIPEAKSLLEARFLKPFLDRHFGSDYPRLDYVKDLKKEELASNVSIHEFYSQAGAYLGNEVFQKNYISLNYTHVARNIFDCDVNLLVQLISKNPHSDGPAFSLSCNPDLTLDIVDMFKKNNKPLLIIGVVHPDLPFLKGDAAVDANFFDAVVESTEAGHHLFALPRTPLDEVDHMIGLYASQLISDDGTLQIGIGSLCDAIVYSTILRHQKNSIYRQLTSQVNKAPSNLRTPLHLDPFVTGLYGTSELITDGFMYLRQAGILKREIFDLDEKKKMYLHGAFYLGSKHFYQWLKSLSTKDANGFSMTRVSKVNDLYDAHELALRRQRKNARFFNTCISMTLLGGAISDTITNGQVVSGIGGQYNFVAMANELPDARSILMLRSCRFQDNKKLSNIIWSVGHISIPRHLRDIVITEYGIADIHGKSDEEVIKALIEISDSEFQTDLIKHAQKNLKLSKDYKLPTWAQNNTTNKLNALLAKVKADGYFKEFPFGDDFTPTESKLAKALGHLKTISRSKILVIKYLMKGFSLNNKNFAAELERMQLQQVRNFKELIFQRLLMAALAERSH